MAIVIVACDEHAWSAGSYFYVTSKLNVNVCGGLKLGPNV